MNEQNLITKWISQAEQILQDHSDTNDPEFCKLCSACFKIFQNYSEAALILIEQGKKRPAMALLRIQCDLAAKFTYLCKGKSQSEKEYEQRYDQWLCKSGKELLKIRNDSLDIIAPEAKEKILETNSICRKSLDDVEKTLQGKIPTDRELIESMFEGSKLHGVGMYRQFHSAVHVDLTVIREVMEKQSSGDYGPEYKDLRLHCLAICAYLVKPVFDYLGVDAIAIIQELQNLIRIERSSISSVES